LLVTFSLASSKGRLRFYFAGFTLSTLKKLCGFYFLDTEILFGLIISGFA
jgi:hypothetical protein